MKDGPRPPAPFVVGLTRSGTTLLRLMLDHWPIDSIRSIPAPMRWDVRRWSIGEVRLSLSQLVYSDAAWTDLEVRKRLLQHLFLLGQAVTLGDGLAIPGQHPAE